MKNFETIRKTCETSSSISKTVIDEFLLYYAAALYKLDRTMTEAFSAYRHVTKEFEKEWVNRLKAQYLAHKIFKSGGLIRKIITHTELKKLSRSEMDFLEHHARQPWRFCFSIIIENPASDFFNMEDILTGERFTLFSQGTSDIIKSQTTSIWFNLIGFNGACWQTFGPIAAYKSFEPDDIFFFATELDRGIETEEDIVQNLEKNPLPYMMLLSGANIPFTAHKQDQMVQVYSEYPVDKVDTVELKRSFTSEFCSGIYRLTLKRWGGHPHFAQVYYDENKKIVLLSASTDRGFLALVNAINQFGYKFSEEPDIRVNMSMLITSKKILTKEIKINEYDHLFQVDTPPERKEMLDNLNYFMSLILPDINAGRVPDIEKNAAKAGIDVETARNFYKAVSDKFGQMDRRKG
ncbi:MAG: hypothetical protein D4R64_03945 [Porphyromonadaceae bacterium]|nr:MAG: hypothetical protein D4R64_03945 [Porphyromonadaceae bacterium]